MSDLLRTKIGEVELRNPILLASGIIASGEEYSEIINFSKIGGIVTKTITLNKRIGNKSPRICETEAGMINSIGLENNGFEYFAENHADFLRDLDCAVIISIAGSSDAELLELARLCNDLDFPVALEANFSCPNVEKGGITYGSSLDSCYDGVKMLREVVTKKPLWVKLSPQVADIGMIGFAAQKAGADAISAINTVPAIEIDPYTFKPGVGNLIGGLSGTSIMPIALKAIYEIVRVCSIPVIGIGGITRPEDIIKFIALGASAVQIGSSLFGNPCLPEESFEFLMKFLKEQNFDDLESLIGEFWKRNNLEK